MQIGKDDGPAALGGHWPRGPPARATSPRKARAAGGELSN